MKAKSPAGERICLLRMKASEMAPFLRKEPPLIREKAAFHHEKAAFQTFSPYTPHTFTHSRRFFHHMGCKLSPYAPLQSPAIHRPFLLQPKPILPIILLRNCGRHTTVGEVYGSGAPDGNITSRISHGWRREGVRKGV